MVGRDPVSRHEPFDPFSHLDDLAGDLVAEDRSRFPSNVPGEEVRPADSGGRGPHERIARPELRDPEVDNRNRTIICNANCFHGNTAYRIPSRRFCASRKRGRSESEPRPQMRREGSISPEASIAIAARASFGV